MPYALRPAPLSPSSLRSAAIICPQCNISHGTLWEFITRHIFYKAIPAKPEWLTDAINVARSSGSGVVEGEFTIITDDLIIHHEQTTLQASFIDVTVQITSAIGEILFRDYDITDTTGRRTTVSSFDATAGRWRFRAVHDAFSKQMVMKVTDRLPPKRKAKRKPKKSTKRPPF